MNQARRSFLSALLAAPFMLSLRRAFGLPIDVYIGPGEVRCLPAGKYRNIVVDGEVSFRPGVPLIQSLTLGPDAVCSLPCGRVGLITVFDPSTKEMFDRLSDG